MRTIIIALLLAATTAFSGTPIYTGRLYGNLDGGGTNNITNVSSLVSSTGTFNTISLGGVPATNWSSTHPASYVVSIGGQTGAVTGLDYSIITNPVWQTSALWNGWSNAYQTLIINPTNGAFLGNIPSSAITSAPWLLAATWNGWSNTYQSLITSPTNGYNLINIQAAAIAPILAGYGSLLGNNAWNGTNNYGVLVMTNTFTPYEITNIVSNGATNWVSGTGTIDITMGSQTVTAFGGIGTLFSTEVSAGNLMRLLGEVEPFGTVQSVTSDTELTLESGSTVSFSGYNYQIGKIYDLTNTTPAYITNSGSLYFSDGSVQTTAYSNSTAQINTLFGGTLALQSWVTSGFTPAEFGLTNCTVVVGGLEGAITNGVFYLSGSVTNGGAIANIPITESSVKWFASDSANNVAYFTRTLTAPHTNAVLLIVIDNIRTSKSATSDQMRFLINDNVLARYNSGGYYSGHTSGNFSGYNATNGVVGGVTGATSPAGVHSLARLWMYNMGNPGQFKTVRCDLEATYDTNVVFNASYTTVVARTNVAESITFNADGGNVTCEANYYWILTKTPL